MNKCNVRIQFCKLKLFYFNDKGMRSEAALCIDSPTRV